MVAMHVGFAKEQESLFGTRTLSREISGGTLIHRRLVRSVGNGRNISHNGGPDVARLATGLYLEVDPSEDDRVPVYFNFFGNRRKPRRLEMQVTAVVRISYQADEFGSLRTALALGGTNVRVHLPNGKKFRLRKDVEIEYYPHRRDGTFWLMEETIAPRSVEILDWDEVAPILGGRPGSLLRVHTVSSSSISEYQLIDDATFLVHGCRSSVEDYGNIIVAHFKKQRTLGTSWEEVERPTHVIVDFPLRGDPPIARPYLLANGEMHFTTRHGHRMISFPT